MPILPGKPSKAKLVAALMASDQQLFGKALSLLEPTYGPVELSSAVFPFTYSDYYKNEMGEELLKVFCSFRKLIEPDEILSFKLKAIECEKSFLREATRESPLQNPSQSPSHKTADQKPLDPEENAGQEPVLPPQTASKRPVSRSVNIDPGYLDRTKLVLATTKDSSHRIYLGQGIYGDIELMYRSGSFVSLEWTYPDYREAFAIEFFNKVRNAYLAEPRETSQKVQQ
jgi:hypothetical protein